MGVLSAIVAIVLGAGAWEASCAAGAGAALAAAIRALAGDSPATLAGACLAALFAVAQIAEHSGGRAEPWLALAAAGWTFAELARLPASPLVAMVPAIVAAVLEPACVPLIALAGIRLVTAPWNRPRWAVAAPLIGGLAVLLAVVAGVARHGVFADLGRHWFGSAPYATTPLHSIGLLAEVLGPLAAVAALAGLVMLVRVRLANLAIVGCIAGALLVDLRAGTTGSVTLGLAAVCAGIALGRFAGMIRIPTGQAFAGATCSVLLLLPPLWGAINHGSRLTNVHASR